MLSIIIPLWLDVDLFERLLESIKAKTEGDYEVIVVESETQEVYKRFSQYKIVSTPAQGHNIAVEKGLEVAKGNYLMWVDVDVVVSKDWWKKIKRIFETDEKIGIMSPLMYPRWDQYVLALHNVPQHLLKPELIDSEEMISLVESREPEFFDLPIALSDDLCKKYWGWPKAGLQQWDYGHEAFMIMSRKCYDDVGAYVKNPSGGTEVNISRNARAKGWRIIAANRVHYWNATPEFPQNYYGRAYIRRGKRLEVI